MPDIVKRVENARRIADSERYDDEFEADGSMLLSEITREPDQETFDGVLRYLMIATESAWERLADHADFFLTQGAAVREMGKYARDGWSSGLWDLDSDSDTSIKVRHPR